MSSIILCLAVAAALQISCRAASDIEALVTNHPPASALLKKPYILVQRKGVVDIAFAKALAIFRRENLLEDVQAAYGAMLPEGEKPDFVIQHVSSNRYSYVNTKNEKCEIEEVVRRVTGDRQVTLVYHTKGRRWFGPFESISQIEACAGDDGKLVYEVGAYCYPHRGAARFVARVFRLIHIYFRNKTEEVTGIARRVAMYIYEQQNSGPSPPKM